MTYQATEPSRLEPTSRREHARIRKGSSQRGHNRFVEELIARIRRAGGTGPITVRPDAGFFAWKLVDTLTGLGTAWSVTVRINASIRTAVEAIDDTVWVDIVYPHGGAVRVPDTTYPTGAGRNRKKRSFRLVVRRTRLTGKAQLPSRSEYGPADWQHRSSTQRADTTTHPRA